MMSGMLSTSSIRIVIDDSAASCCRRTAISRTTALMLTRRDPHETHRVATPLELLFDLTFATSFGLAASEVAPVLAAGRFIVGLVGFGFASFSISRRIADQKAGRTWSAAEMQAHEKLIAADYAKLKKTPLLPYVGPSPNPRMGESAKPFSLPGSGRGDRRKGTRGDVECSGRLVENVRRSSVLRATNRGGCGFRGPGDPVVLGFSWSLVFDERDHVAGQARQSREPREMFRARVRDMGPISCFRSQPNRPNIRLDDRCRLVDCVRRGFVYALLKPSRGIPDLTAGTYLVPK